MLVNTEFQVLFTPPQGFFHLSFTGTSPSIGHWVVFGLSEGGPPSSVRIPRMSASPLSDSRRFGFAFRLHDSHILPVHFPK